MENKKVYAVEFKRPNTKRWRLKSLHFTRREAIQERNVLNSRPDSFCHPIHRVVTFVPEVDL